MTPGRPFLAERIVVVILAAAVAVILGWSASGARPADDVLNPHEGIPCAGCHMSSAARSAGGVEPGPRPQAAGGDGSGPAAEGGDRPPAPASEDLPARGPSAADRECAACHTRLDRVSSLAAVFHGPGSERCTSCHTFHEPGRITAGTVSFAYDFGNPALRAQCASCHAAGGELVKVSDGHRDAAAAVYHVDARRLADLSPSGSCLLCHSHQGGGTNLPASAAQAPRFHEEATHPYGEPLPLGHATGGFAIRRKVDARIVLFAGRIECQTCHAVADDVEDLLVRFEHEYDLCLGCHERHPAAGGGPSLAASASPLDTESLR